MIVRNGIATQHTTVLIVGGGPSGLASAAELGMRKVDCIVIEPRVTVSHARPRAKTTTIRTMEHLRRWGAAAELRDAAPLPVAWAQRVTVCESLSGPRILDFDESFGLSTERLSYAAEFGQQIPQPVLEEVMRTHVSGLDPVELRLGHQVLDLESQGEGWLATVQDSHGEQYSLSADYVLGCDGSAGVVRRSIGAAYTGRSDERVNFNVVFRAPDLDTPLGSAVQYWVVGSETPGVIGRLDLKGLWWAIFPGVTLEEGRGQVEELIEGLVGRPLDFTLIASDSWTAHMLIADRFRRGTAFLVGDSAHLNPPWGGHGYNSCVGDAVNIAWKIAAVEQRWADRAVLESYEPERRAVIQQTIQLAEKNMAALPSDLATDADAIRHAKSGEFYSLGLVLGYSYAGSPIVQPDEEGEQPAEFVSERYEPSTSPGARLPHHWLPDGRSLYDTLGTGFSILAPDPDGPSIRELTERAQREGMPLSVVPMPLGYPWSSDYLLVRPDQHIAQRHRDPADIDLDAAVGRAVLPETSNTWPVLSNSVSSRTFRKDAV